ncbi:sensor histidine kinase, partial [Klebsiella oxytoca]
TKTPIANVLLYTQLLEEQAPEDCRDCTTALGEQARKLQALIEALVKTSRLEAGVLILRPRPGPLGPMLEEAAGQ